MSAIEAILTPESFALGVASLTERDPVLARIIERLGPPELWKREPGFATLIKIILEQQVSLASAAAAFDRLEAALGAVVPDRFLTLDDAQLKTIGFSRQKTEYGRVLARAILAGDLDLTALAEMEDAAVLSSLTRIKGIGVWTAHIYLLVALRRPDAWPDGDRALAVAYQYAAGLAECPSYEELARLATAWQPWRAVAAQILWHYYLGGRPAL